MVTLSKLGRGELALPSLSKWLQDGEPELRMASLDTFGRVSAYFDGQLDVAPVLVALQDSSVAIRQAACRAMSGLQECGCRSGACVALYPTPMPLSDRPPLNLYVAVLIIAPWFWMCLIPKISSLVTLLWTRFLPETFKLQTGCVTMLARK